MSSLMILLLIGFAATAVLLACLKALSRAQRHAKVEGMFAKVEKSKGRLPERRKRSLVDDRQRKPDLSGGRAAHRVCGSTAALVEMAIILGSKNISSSAQSGSAEPKRPRLRHRVNVRVPECNR